VKGEGWDEMLIVRCSARIQADKAKQVLGWKAERGESGFLEEIEDVVMTMLQQGEGE
jgi:hypothetical protein